MYNYDFPLGSKQWKRVEALLDAPNAAEALDAWAKQLGERGAAQQIRFLNTAAEIADGEPGEPDSPNNGFLSTLGATILDEQTRRIRDNEGRGYTVRPLTAKQLAIVARDILHSNSIRRAVVREQQEAK